MQNVSRKCDIDVAHGATHFYKTLCLCRNDQNEQNMFFYMDQLKPNCSMVLVFRWHNIFTNDCDDIGDSKRNARLINCYGKCREIYKRKAEGEF